MEPVPSPSITSLLVVPDAATGRVRVTTEVRGDASGLQVHVEARDRGGTTAVTSGLGEAIELELDRPRLWSPERPFLYDLEVGLLTEEFDEVDRVRSYFGLRDVALVRDDAGVLPLERAPERKPGLPYHSTVDTRNRLVVVILSRDVRGFSGRVLGRELRWRVPDARVIFVDRGTNYQ